MINELKNYKALIDGDFINQTDLKLSHGVIAEITESKEMVSNRDLLIPGFVDLQIYGAGGHLFSAAPSIAAITQIEETLLQQGTTGFLICLATNTPAIFNSCIEIIKEHRTNAKNCLGVHLEGPFLNPKKRGAHVLEYIRKASLDEIKQLLDFGDGTIKMMTLAPELQDDEVIQYLLDNNVIVSLGHSDANYLQATKAYNQGIQTTTHLFNAMSPIHHREPGIPTAVFNHNKAMASVIADGMHVDFEVVKFAHKLMRERLFFITDAVTECSTGPYQHQAIDGKFVLPDGTLSGSAITMLQAVKNGITHCDIDIITAVNMATLYPARLINSEHSFGSIKEGAMANLLVVDDELNLKKVIFKGQEINVSKQQSI